MRYGNGRGRPGTGPLVLEHERDERETGQQRLVVPLIPTGDDHRAFARDRPDRALDHLPSEHLEHAESGVALEREPDALAPTRPRGNGGSPPGAAHPARGTGLAPGRATPTECSARVRHGGRLPGLALPLSRSAPGRKPGDRHRLVRCNGLGLRLLRWQGLRDRRRCDPRSCTPATPAAPCSEVAAVSLGSGVTATVSAAAGSPPACEVTWDRGPWTFVLEGAPTRLSNGFAPTTPGTSSGAPAPSGGIPGGPVATAILAQVTRTPLPPAPGVLVADLAPDGVHTTLRWAIDEVVYLVGVEHGAAQAVALASAMRAYPG